MVVPITVGGSENSNSQISGLCRLAYEPTEYVVKSTGFMGQTQVLPIVMWVKKSKFVIHAVRWLNGPTHELRPIYPPLVMAR